MKAKLSATSSRDASPKSDESNAGFCGEDIEAVGFIKWFDIGKGYGFVTLSKGPYEGRDALLPLEVLRRGGFSVSPVGAYVECSLRNSTRGLQCSHIDKIDVSTAVHPLEVVDRTHDDIMPESALEEAMVKWFNYEKGFGFLKGSATEGDIFIHMETLRRFGFTEIFSGQKVWVRYGFTKKGAMAAEIFPDPRLANFVKH